MFRFSTDDDQGCCGAFDKSCGICGNGDGGCLASMAEDLFTPATKEQIIERLNNNRYTGDRNIMIATLKEKFNYDYIEERKEKLMKPLTKL